MSLKLETFWFEDENDSRVRDLHDFKFLRILKIVSPESFILLFFSVKVITVILSEGGYVLSLSQNDKISNIW